MPRVELPITVIDSSGNAVSGASGTVTKRVDGSSATIYTTESGGTTTTNPLTSTADGRFEGWVDANTRYQVAITATGLSSYTEYFDAVSGDTGVRGSYTPTWTASSVNPSLGNGTLVGSYARVGDWFAVTIALTVGSTTTAGTGSYTFSLPFTVVTLSGARWVWQVDVLDAGVQHYNGWATIASAGTGTSEILWSSTTQTGANVGAASPVAFGTNDQITITGLCPLA